jgi:uncharacterized membrane protein
MWWIGPCVLMMIVCMVMMFRMMGHGTSRAPWTTDWWPGNRTDAEHILAERLAPGEIDAQEYERLRAALRERRESERT